MSENLKERCIFQDKNPYNPYNLKTNPYNPYNFRVKKNQSVQSVHFGHPVIIIIIIIIIIMTDTVKERDVTSGILYSSSLVSTSEKVDVLC